MLSARFPGMEFRGEKGILNGESAPSLKRGRVTRIEIEVGYSGGTVAALMSIDDKSIALESRKAIHMREYLDWTFGELAATLVLAHAYVNDYQLCQSTSNLGNLRIFGWLSNQKIVSDPFWGEIADVSQNPGLMVARGNPLDADFHLEAVGAVMWLGPKFEKVCGRPNLDALTSTQWCQIVQSEPGVTRIVSADELFDSDEGELAMRQRALRNALFPHRRPVCKDGDDVRPQE